MFYRYVIVFICYVLFHCVLFSVIWAFLPEINVMMRMAVSSCSVWDLGRSSIQHGSLRCVLKHENDSCDKTYLDRFRITEWMWRVWDPDGIRFEMTPACSRTCYACRHSAWTNTGWSTGSCCVYDTIRYEMLCIFTCAQKLMGGPV